MKRLKFKYQTIKNAMDEILNEMEETKGMRVAEKAVVEMQGRMENVLREMVKQAALFANHTGRRTIKREDILLAIEVLKTKGQM